MLGFTIDEYLALPVKDRLPEESFPIAVRELTENLAKVKSGLIDPAKHFFRFEMLHKHKNGKLIWGEVNCSFLLGPDGNLTGIHGITRDISERKRIEQELTLSQAVLKEIIATKDKFFSIIAHDLKNPLGTMMQTFDFLSVNPDSFNSQENWDLLNSIKESAVNTYKLLENLLSWANFQQGLIPFLPQKYVLKSTIELNINLLNSFAKQKNISLTHNILDSVLVLADINMLNTVLRNIINNAIKYTRSNGIIKIDCIENELEIIVSVADNGVGMAPDTINKLFRIDSNNSQLGTANEKGTGLGLILCKEFIEKHRGRIWAESIPANGSTFFIALPVKL
jgi:PAS domain S-box-containing protein